MRRFLVPPGQLHSLPAEPGHEPGWNEPDEEWLRPAALLALGLFVCWMMPSVGLYYLLAYFPVLALFRITSIFRVGLLEWIVFVSVAGNLAGLMVLDTDWSSSGSRTIFLLWAAQLLSFLILGLAWSQRDERRHPSGAVRKLIVVLTGTLPCGFVLYVGHGQHQHSHGGAEVLLLMAAIAVYLSLLGLRWAARTTDLLALGPGARASVAVAGILIPLHIMVLALLLIEPAPADFRIGFTAWVAILMIPVVRLHRMAAASPWRNRRELQQFCRRRIARRRRLKRLGKPVFPHPVEPCLEDRAIRWLRRLPWSCWLATAVLFLVLAGMPAWTAGLLAIQGMLGTGLYFVLKSRTAKCRSNENADAWVLNSHGSSLQ